MYHTLGGTSRHILIFLIGTATNQISLVGSTFLSDDSGGCGITDETSTNGDPTDTGGGYRRSI